MHNDLKIIRKPEVLLLIGLSKSTLHSRINDGLMPPPISLGYRAIGFIEYEIQEILTALIQGNSKTAIKSLVQELIEQRKLIRGIK